MAVVDLQNYEFPASKSQESPKSKSSSAESGAARIVESGIFKIEVKSKASPVFCVDDPPKVSV